MFATLKNLVYLEGILLAGYAIFYVCLSRRGKKDVGIRPAIVFTLLTAAAFLSPNLWVVHLAFLAVTPALARSREDVGAIYIVALLATPNFSAAAALTLTYCRSARPARRL